MTTNQDSQPLSEDAQQLADGKPAPGSWMHHSGLTRTSLTFLINIAQEPLYPITTGDGHITLFTSKARAQRAIKDLGRPAPNPDGRQGAAFAPWHEALVRAESVAVSAKPHQVRELSENEVSVLAQIAEEVRAHGKVVSVLPPWYDPLSTPEVQRTIRRYFDELDDIARPLGAVLPFEGAGLYALYFAPTPKTNSPDDSAKHSQDDAEREAYRRYRDLYAPIAHTTVPIYVGQALSLSSSTGKASNRKPLYSRLNDHRESITRGKGLSIDDFVVRCLLMPDVHIALGEAALIQAYQPVWNVVLRGFGSHVQGGNRSSRPGAWDTLHDRGRGTDSKPSGSTKDWIDKVTKHFASSRGSGAVTSPGTGSQ